MDTALVATDLTKHFGSVVALEGLDLEVAPGEVLGFLGPNGAGKTTTLRLLLGLLEPTRGQARVLGHRAGSAGARASVAYVPGDVNLWPQLTGAETVAMLGAFHGSLDEAYRDELFRRFELDPDRRVRALSKGNRQKVALVAAFATRAPVLLLDEPTSGLDPLMELQFRRCMVEARERGAAVLLSSHILSEVEHLCERVAMVREGHLVTTATMTELRARVGLEVEVVGEIGDLSAVPGVLGATPTEDGVRLQLSGPPGPLLAALATQPVTSLRTREASLEEIFMGLYRDGPP